MLGSALTCSDVDGFSSLQKNQDEQVGKEQVELEAAKQLELIEQEALRNKRKKGKGKKSSPVLSPSPVSLLGRPATTHPGLGFRLTTPAQCSQW